MKYLIFNLEKQYLRPSLFNVNINIRNQHVLKCRKSINFGCSGRGAMWGSSAHGLWDRNKAEYLACKPALRD